MTETTAHAIEDKIKSLDPLAMLSWGIWDYKSDAEGIYLETSGLVQWVGHIHIKHTSVSDLYDIEYYQSEETGKNIEKVLLGVKGKDLVNVIDQQVM